VRREGEATMLGQPAKLAGCSHNISFW